MTKRPKDTANVRHREFSHREFSHLVRMPATTGISMKWASGMASILRRSTVTSPRAVARDTCTGWRIDKAESRQQIDAVIALAMAVEQAERKPEPVKLLGWL
jgi:hypothetical protein